MLADLDFLNTRLPKENENALIYHSDHKNACDKSHAIAIITEWDEFQNYDWNKIYKKMIRPAKLFDGRNILDKKVLEKIGFEVYSIGKPFKSM